jgi:RNA polymerase sigma-70 factor (ECF subfamily)
VKSAVVVENADNLAVAVHRNVDGAIDRLVELYQDALFSYALRLLQDRFDAQEVAQDALLRAIRALTARYDEERCRDLDLRPWLFRITRNLAYNWRRARRYSAEVPLTEANDGPGQSFRSQRAAERTLDDLEQQASMQMALDRLSPGVRDLILLRFMEEMSYSEIAAVVNSSESSVRGKVFRALRKLRKALEKMEDRNAM